MHTRTQRRCREAGPAADRSVNAGRPGQVGADVAVFRIDGRAGEGDGIALVKAGAVGRRGDGHHRRLVTSADEFELAHSGTPASRRRDPAELVGVPERVAVGIDVGGAVVPGAACPIGTGLPGAAFGLVGVKDARAGLGRRLARHPDRGREQIVRDHKADADVTGVVNGDAGHPAPEVVSRAVGAFLVEEPVGPAVGAAQFIPSDARAPGSARRRTVYVYRMRRHHRQVRAEVFDLQTMHQPSGERLQVRARPRMRHTPLSRSRAQVGVERSDGHPFDARDGGVGRRDEVRHDLPDIEEAVGRHRRAEERRHKARRARRIVEVAGQEAELTAAQVRPDERTGRVARINASLVCHADERPTKGKGRRNEEVRHHRDGIGRKAELGIIVEAKRRKVVGIAVVGTERIARLRNGDAL